jgi:hypothetical protein
MTLSLGFTSPHDLLGKAERDLARLNQAIAAQEKGQIGDALYDFSVSVSSIKDWLKAHPSKLYLDADVEALVSGSTALNSFRDIANANKHRIITHYTPKTNEVTVSVLPYTMLAGSSNVGRGKRFRVKIISADGSRLEAGALAPAAVEEWRAFITKHGV